MARVLQVFLNADLRNSHDGLRALAKKEKIEINTLQEGEYLLFINSERNKLKLFAANNVLAYLKLDRGKIEMRTISLIPKAFMGSGKIDYDAALKEVVVRELGDRSSWS